MFAAVVRNCPSTFTAPFSSETPASATASPSVTGARPTATSRYSASRAESWSPRPTVILTRLLATSADLAVAWVSTLIPRRENPRSSACPISSSSSGTNVGSSSITVTSLPKARNRLANSTPTGPAPRMAIDRGAVHGQAQFPGIFEVFEQFGGVQHGLGGNAADVQAGPADLFPLHQRHSEPELCGADGTHIPAGTTADDDEIVRIRHRQQVLRA